MHHDMNPQGNRPDGEETLRSRAERAQPLSDREVPLTPATRTSPSIHAWLDGEVEESAVRTADTSRDIDFWRKVTEETERRRAVRTPAYLEAQIMSALPGTTADGVQPWWRKEVVMTPTGAAAAAAGLLAIGAAATVAVLRTLR